MRRFLLGIAAVLGVFALLAQAAVAGGPGVTHIHLVSFTGEPKSYTRALEKSVLYAEAGGYNRVEFTTNGSRVELLWPWQRLDPRYGIEWPVEAFCYGNGRYAQVTMSYPVNELKDIAAVTAVVSDIADGHCSN